MNAVLDRAQSVPVTGSSDSSAGDRGAAIRERFEALGISEREWHAKTGIDRKTLHRAMENHPGSRTNTYVVIESWLDKLEAYGQGKPVAMQPALDPPPQVIRIEVKGVVYGGVEALVVEGPVDDPELLEAMVDRIMRRMQAGNDSDTP